MSNIIHAIRDEIVRCRVGLAISLNELYAVDPEGADLAYSLCLQVLHDYYKGNQNKEDVEEKGNIS